MKNQENRLFTSELLETLASYPLYSQEQKKIGDLFAVALFRIGSIRWYVLEGNTEGDRFTFFTLVCGLADGPELGYTDAEELAEIAVDASRYGMRGVLLQVEQVEDFPPPADWLTSTTRTLKGIATDSRPTRKRRKQPDFNTLQTHTIFNTLQNRLELWTTEKNTPTCFVSVARS